MYEIETGSKIITEGRLATGGIFESLEACEHWDAAEFVFPNSYGETPALACNVKITGKKVRFDAPGLHKTPVIRVRVTFPGDGEPDTEVGGWALLTSDARSVAKEFAR